MVRHQIIANAQKHNHFAVAIEHRIVQCPKAGTHVAQAGHLPIQHIEKACKKHQCTAPPNVRHVATIRFFGTKYKNYGHTNV
ncbi:hypothetical protein D3C73_1263990 [compost metagenome]